MNPDRLKRSIMIWARDHAPELVGHTRTPAVNWFTRGKARRELTSAGFVEVWDRWDLRHLDAETGLRRSEVTNLTVTKDGINSKIAIFG